MCTTLKWNEVVTRKPHKCYACLRVLPAKSEMISWSCVGEGQWNSGYYCRTCQEMMSYLGHDEWRDGFVADNLGKDQTPEQLLEEYKQDYNDRQAKIRQSGKTYQIF